MKESLDQSIAQFIEKKAAALRTVTSEGSLAHDELWTALADIFEFNCLYIYDKEDGVNFRKCVTVKRNLLDVEPFYKDYIWLINVAFKEDKPKSDQKEERLKDDMVFVKAIAAIPLVIGDAKKVIFVCKQLVKPRDEVVEGFVFDSYKLEVYLAVLKILVRIQELQQQLSQSKSQINLFKLAIIAAGVLALLEGLSSARDILNAASPFEVIIEISMILLLILLFAAVVRLWTPSMLFKYFKTSIKALLRREK